MIYVVCGATFLELERVSDSLIDCICFFVVKSLPTNAGEARESCHNSVEVNCSGSEKQHLPLVNKVYVKQKPL